MKSSNDNHAREPVRFSRLKLMAKSAAHFAAGYGEETSPMRKGTAVHAYLLGGEKKVVVYEGGRRDDRIKQWQAFKREHEGKHILIPSELGDVAGMRKSLERHKRAMELLDGVQENRIHWSLAGRDCMGTPDVVIPKNGKTIGVELKTDQTSHPERFVWKCRKMAYHAQCAWYRTGIELCGNYRPARCDEYYMVVVESTAPYPVTVFRLDEPSLEAGEKLNRLWLEQLLVCEKENHFPAYAESDVELSLVETETELDWEAA